MRSAANLVLVTAFWMGVVPAVAQQQHFTVSPGSINSRANQSRVIVRFNSGTSFLPGSGASHALGANNVHVVNNPPGLSVGDVIARYKNNPNVVYAEPDYIRSINVTPADPLWGGQWDMVKINAPGAWNTQTNASDVIVAVIDTGVDFTHPDLQGNLWVNPADGSHGYTCMNGTCAAGGQDDYGHGTHVAGTIGATANNGIGIAGINWRTQILSCKFLGSDGSGSDSDAVLCFNQILALKQQGFNIRVTNNSWGGGSFSQTLKDAMAAVEAAGILDVCAAGNSGINADLGPMYPAGYDNHGIVSVSATDQNDVAAYFTNFGVATVDLAAPGVSTLSTVPMGTCPLCDPSGYRTLSGTSMATPHVTAVAVAMFHLNPALTATQARDVLLDRASYDALTDPIANMSSTGGRLNFQKVVVNPLLMAPKANNFPSITGVSNVFANAGSIVNLSASASDPDGDPLRMVWSSPSLSSLGLFGYISSMIFPAATGSSVSFAAPVLARTAVGTYAVSVADGRGGSALGTAYATIQPSGTAGTAPSGTLTVSPLSGPVGTTVTVSFPVTDPAGASTAWDLWQTTTSSGSGNCCYTSSSTTLTFSAAGAYRITAQAIDSQLNLSDRQTTVVRIGGATGTPPIARATFDTLSGAAPLTVNIDMSSSVDPDGTIQSYITNCNWGSNGVSYSGVKTSCTYSTPGVYWIILQVLDNSGFLDILPAYVVVTPTGGSSGGGTTKQTATVTLANLTQTYTGGVLTPAATTNPPGLAIVWTNAPQTSAGNYAVTATVNDPNYQGAASGTFTINKAPVSVSLGNLTQTYNANPLTPTATTSVAGLNITWTNAPQTKAGSYTVTGTVNNPNYQGSATGTFTINKANASVTMANLTQVYTGSALAPSASTAPLGLQLTWTNAPDTNVGSYAVTAVINDPNYQGSASGMFTISQNTSTVPPKIAVTSPTNGTVLKPKSLITIQVTATAGTYPLARVDYLVNGSIVCSASGAAYSCSWSVPAAPAKTYQIQAKATDTGGQVAASAVVTVTSSH